MGAREGTAGGDGRRGPREEDPERGGRTEDEAQVRQGRRRDVAEACLSARRVRC